jgi:FRG domain
MVQGPDTYYGLDAWRWWLSEAPSDMRKARRSVDEVADTDACDVRSFRALIKLVAFLNVMNKSDILLFRGQGCDLPLLPSLMREKWTVPGTSISVPLDGERVLYFEELSQVCRRVAPLLVGLLPRHKPFETFVSHPERRMAPWSVIQHYELWPTPVLDFTGSLRIAASFALGAAKPRSSGYVYISAFRRVHSDPMVLHTAGSGPVAVRLSAVCPPLAERPHLQDGFLVGNPRFSKADLETPQAPGTLLAKVHLVDESATAHSGESFWDDRDFPRHSEESLLPTGDLFLKMFNRAFEHQVVGDRAVIADR